MVSAAQLSYVAHPLFAVTATFGWGRSRGLAFATTPKLDVLNQHSPQNLA